MNRKEATPCLREDKTRKSRLAPVMIAAQTVEENACQNGDDGDGDGIPHPGLLAQFAMQEGLPSNQFEEAFRGVKVQENESYPSP